MKVLFITYYWPPAGGVSAQRIIHFVRNLSMMGVECHVICPQGASYYQVDESLSSLIPSDVMVHRVKIRDITRLVKSVPKMGTEGNVKSKAGGPINQLSKWLRANFFIPDPKVNWVKPVIKKASSLLHSEHFDLIFTNGTPHSVHLSGKAIKEKYDIPWIADFRDPWTKIDYFESMPLSSASLKKHQVLESEVIKSADVCLTVSPSWRDDFIDLGAKRAVCITNGYDEKIEQIPSPDFLVSHVGSLHGDRSLEDLLIALELLIQNEIPGQAKCKLVLVGNVNHETIQKVKSKISEDRLIMPGIVSHQEAKKWIAQSSILLLPINETKDARGRIPAKLFEYLSSHVPIAVLGGDDGDACKIVFESHSGQCFSKGDSDALLEYMKRLKSQKIERIPDKALIDKYSRENTAKQLLALIKGLI